jgi:hypothetical protein
MVMRHLSAIESFNDLKVLIQAFFAYLEVQFTHINIQEKMTDQKELNTTWEGEASELSVENNLKAAQRN